MANHLFIGLGGTGGKVLRELRKRVYEEFKSNDPTRGSAHIDYLYVDSCNEEEWNDRSGWKVLGKSVHLADTQKVYIHGINPSMLDNINMYPGIKAFLNSEDISFLKKKMSLVEKGVGGQRRRLGRTLLANNLASNDLNNDFVSRLKQVVKRLSESSGEHHITFHICAGLAGGTGSGTIIDIISQIRKEYPPEQGNLKYHILLYLYVPEMNVVNSGHDEGFYQANGYAALLELNAISVHRYLPVDITGEKDLFSGEVKRLLQDIEPFEAAFLYSNVNECGKGLDISYGLPKAVADFLFQHTIASEMIGGAQLGRLIGFENDGAGPENDSAGQPTRSRKFLSFGIKRIEYPETEIKEYVTYTFVQQAARQLEYNKWDGGLGFVELTSEEIGSGFVGEIKDKGNRERLMLSNNYLMLSKAIIENKETKRWKDIPSTWEDRTTLIVDDVKEDAEKERWLSEFTDRCEEYFNKLYRTHGVKAFYDVYRGERLAYARHIRKHIERILFEEWSSGLKHEQGGKSISEVEEYLKLLIKDCGDRIEDIQKRTDSLRNNIDDVNAAIRDVKDKWSRINWTLEPVLRRTPGILEEYSSKKCEYYTIVTRLEGYRYAIELLQDLIRELSIAKESVSAFKGRLMHILEEVKKQIASRCQNETEKEGGLMQKRYNPELVHQLVKSYIATEDMQRDNAQNIRNLLISTMGEDGERSFSNLCDKTDEQSMVDMMLDVCEKRAITEMENSAKRDPVYKMVSVNILEKLKQDLSGDGKLEDFVRKIKESAKTFVQYNAQEQGKVKLSNSGGGMKTMLQLCIPKYEGDTTGFRDKLIKEFSFQVPDFDPKQDVAENYKENQIVVIAATSGFPLRYLSNLTIIKQKYDELLANPEAELNKMMLHTESFKDDLPSLYELDTKTLKQMITKPVMLAYAMGLIQTQEDPITQQKFDAINLPDKELAILGVDNWVKLGSNILDTIEVLSENYEQAKKVMEKVKDTQATYRSIDQKTELKKSLGEVLAKIKACPACENNQYNQTYLKYQGIAIELVKEIDK